MPKSLKEEIRERFNEMASKAGCPDLLDRIADETFGVAEEEVLNYLTEKQHPALTMDPIF
jgi:acetyl-CoA synthase